MSPEKTTSLSKSQVEDLARPFVGMVDRIKAFYDDPENQRAFREWYLREYGHSAPDGS